MSAQDVMVATESMTAAATGGAVVLDLHPEKDADQLILAPPDQRDTVLAIYRKRAESLVPKDAVTLKICAEFVAECKEAAKRVEEKRVERVKPFNDEVDAINAVRIPVRELFKDMAKVVTARVNQYNYALEQKAELEQQQRNREAELRQAELDRKADEARAAAQVAQEAGDVKAAIKLESKALELEQKAAAVVPEQAMLPSNKVEVGEATVSFNGPKKVWSLPGWDKKKPLPVLSPELAKLVGDLSKLPAEIQFLLQHADLNPVRLNASYKGGMKFPAPFAIVNDFSGSSLRG